MGSRSGWVIRLAVAVVLVAGGLLVAAAALIGTGQSRLLGGLCAIFAWLLPAATALWLARQTPRADVLPPLVHDFADLVPIGVACLDLHGRFLFANRAMARLLAVDLAALAGRRVTEALPPGLAELHLASDQAAWREEGPVVANEEALLADGIHHVLTWRQVGAIGDRRLLVVCSVDVTELTQRDQELAAVRDTLENQARELVTLAEDMELARLEAEAARGEAEEQREIMRRLAAEDFLTGLASRRHFLERGAELVESARATAGPLTLLMMDLDHFKRINDRHGHAAGDAALVAFADLARACLPAALIGRLGGEEFAALLPGEAGGEEAEALAERLRAAVAAAELSCGEARFRLTVSVGLARLAPADGGVEALLKRADDALYAAKAAGRDRVVLAEDHEGEGI